MNDKELADKVVAKGVGQCQHGKWYGYDHSGDTAEIFVRDWRVAGEIMELCARQRKTIALSFGPDMFCATGAESCTPTYGVYLERSNESAPRAIIEAGVEYINAD